MKDDKKKKKSKVERKKKKVEDENINEESIESIDDADESFGLPDVDFKPLDEVEEPEPEIEPEGEPETEQEIEPDLESEIESVEEVASEETQENAFSEEESEFENLEAGTDEPEPEPEPESALEDESQPVRVSYVPPKQPSVLPKILLGILFFIIILVAVWFFGFHQPEQKALAEKANKEALIAEQKRDAAKKAEEERRIQAELAAAEAETAAEEESTKPEPGTISIITERTGRYYIVIGSFVDGDLANDYGKELAAKGSGIIILTPPDRGFYRVALSDYSSWTEAQTNANGLKEDYGENVWVLKY